MVCPSGAWCQVWRTSAVTRLSTTSAYRFTVRPAKRTTYHYRAFRPADADHLSVTSGTLSLRATQGDQPRSRYGVPPGAA